MNHCVIHHSTWDLYVTAYHADLPLLSLTNFLIGFQRIPNWGKRGDASPKSPLATPLIGIIADIVCNDKMPT